MENTPCFRAATIDSSSCTDTSGDADSAAVRDTGTSSVGTCSDTDMIESNRVRKELTKEKQARQVNGQYLGQRMDSMSTVDLMMFQTKKLDVRSWV